MSVLDFPSSPTNGQYYNGFIWNAANETWDSSFAPRAATIPIATPNVVINGGFDIWQRGTTTTLGTTGLANYYTADRWATFNPAGTGALAQDTVNVPSFLRFGLRFTASASNASCNFYHTIETANTIPLVGRVVTLSIYLTGTVGSNVQVALNSSTTVDAGWTTTFTNFATETFAVTATSTRYTVTGVVPSNAKTLQVFVGSGALVNTGFVSLTGVQLEAGAAPTEFRRSAPSIQGELAACQRYYYRINADTGFAQFGLATSRGGTLSEHGAVAPVPMRVAPTSVEWASLLTSTFAGGTNATVTSISINGGSNTRFNPNVSIQTATNNGTGGQALQVIANNTTNAFLGFNAEL
jgi:hypothetical protein